MDNEKIVPGVPLTEVVAYLSEVLGGLLAVTEYLNQNIVALQQEIDTLNADTSDVDNG